jgi:hypothetical protein
MTTPTLCKKHFNQVANYFDKGVALEFELDGESCVICANVIYLESARRFIEQKNKEERVEES